MDGREGDEARPRHDWRCLARGALIGAALVGLLAGLLSELIREPAQPGVLAVFAALGAVLGAYAWGVVAYEHDHDPSMDSTTPNPAPSAREPEDHGVSPLRRLWRKHGAGLIRLPLAPWI